MEHDLPSVFRTSVRLPIRTMHESSYRSSSPPVPMLERLETRALPNRNGDENVIRTLAANVCETCPMHGNIACERPYDSNAMKQSPTAIPCCFGSEKEMAGDSMCTSGVVYVQDIFDQTDSDDPSDPTIHIRREKNTFQMGNKVLSPTGLTEVFGFVSAFRSSDENPANVSRNGK